MTLNEYFQNSKQYLFEDAVGVANADGGTNTGTTTSANVAYIPGQMGMVTPYLKKMSKKKTTWNVKREKYPSYKKYKIEEDLNIQVNNGYEDCFERAMFGTQNVPDEFELDLSSYLVESFEDEMALARADFKQAATGLFNSETFKGYRHKAAGFVQKSGDKNLNFSTIGKSLLTEPSADRQISQFIQFVDKAYAQDKGSLETLTDFIEQRKPLQSIELFRGLDNLTGTAISGSFLGYQFEYTSLIGLDFVAQETFKVTDKDLINRLKTVPFMKLDNDKFYPIDEKGFPYNFVDLLSKYITGDRS